MFPTSSRNKSTTSLSPRPSSGRKTKSKSSSSSSTRPNISKSNAKSVRKTSRPVSARPYVARNTTTKDEKHLEPYFELNGEYSFACAERRTSQTNLASTTNVRPRKVQSEEAFSPDANRLKKQGGKSIDLYADWRAMQYQFNIVMNRFLTNHGVNVSVLPPCNDYAMWRSMEWRKLYADVLCRNLDEDPCPDCDVRFFKDKEVKNKYTFKVAPASILQDERWSKRKYLNTVFVIGLPQHITIACVKEASDHVLFEFFDPAGKDGDSASVKAVKQWVGTYLGKKYGKNGVKKDVVFSQVVKSINCQNDKQDVMCQTWIWYWVYWKFVRQANTYEIIKHIKGLLNDKQTLQHISSFHYWLSRLHRLGYVQKEGASEKQAAKQGTPPRMEDLKRMKQRIDSIHL